MPIIPTIVDTTGRASTARGDAGDAEVDPEPPGAQAARPVCGG